MRAQKVTAAAMAVSMACLPLTAQAADAEPNAATNAETARLNAEAANLTAQKALVEAKAGALGLPKFSGRTTMGEGAGAMEASMLSGATLNRAAAKIVGSLKGQTGGRPILLLTSGEVVDLALPDVLGEDIDAIESALASAAASGICAPTVESYGVPKSFSYLSKPGKAAAPPATVQSAAKPQKADEPDASNWIGVALDLFKSETTVSGLKVEEREGALINAIAGHTDQDWILLSEFTALPPLAKGDLRSRFRTMLKFRDHVALCSARLAQLPEAKRPGRKIAEFNALVDRADAFSKLVTTPTEDNTSLLIQASRLDAVRGLKPLVLRVTVDEAGGTLHQQENLWTIFGASGVRISGGLIVNYRLVDPFTGRPPASGALVCRTDLTSMKAVHRGRAGGSDCELATLP